MGIWTLQLLETTMPHLYLALIGIAILGIEASLIILRKPKSVPVESASRRYPTSL